MTKALYRVSAIMLSIGVMTSSVSANTIIHVLRAETNNAEKSVYQAAKTEYEAAHQGVEVQFEYIANEAYKQKLTTLLQSDSRPDLFYSWGGGILREQYKAGFLSDITSEVSDTWSKTYSQNGIDAFSVDGHIVGAPMNAAEVVFWTNLKLARQAGIDIDKIKTWDDFLAAVKKAKDAGITPIMVGGKDKWPLHFYYGYLAVRSAGKAGFEAAMEHQDDGFASADFVRAGKEFQRLVELEPFQAGYMGTGYEQASGRFGDGEALFELMGDWEYQTAKANSSSGKGIPDEDLGLLRFPALEGGKGAPTDTFGGVNGWAVAKGASQEAIDFLIFMNGKKYQEMSAAMGIYIPTVKGADEALPNKYFKTIAAALNQSSWHLIFLDQELGADVGATFNDVSADLAAGVVSPEDAAQAIQDAWEFR